MVSAPFALSVLDGQPLQPVPPRSRLRVLLYAQAQLIDGADRRNVLLGRKPALWQRRTFETGRASYAYGDASFSAHPLGADLGTQRILRTSALTPVPPIC
jgi:hypothetical protein